MDWLPYLILWLIVSFAVALFLGAVIDTGKGPGRRRGWGRAHRGVKLAPQPYWKPLDLSWEPNHDCH